MAERQSRDGSIMPEAVRTAHRSPDRRRLAARGRMALSWSPIWRRRPRVVVGLQAEKEAVEEAGERASRRRCRRDGALAEHDLVDTPRRHMSASPAQSATGPSASGIPPSRNLRRDAVWATAGSTRIGRLLTSLRPTCAGWRRPPNFTLDYRDLPDSLTGGGGGEEFDRTKVNAAHQLKSHGRASCARCVHSLPSHFVHLATALVAGRAVPRAVRVCGQSWEAADTIAVRPAGLRLRRPSRRRTLRFHLRARLGDASRCCLLCLARRSRS